MLWYHLISTWEIDFLFAAHWAGSKQAGVCLRFLFIEFIQYFCTLELPSIANKYEALRNDYDQTMIDAMSVLNT